MTHTAAGPSLKAAAKTAPDVANPWEDEEEDGWEDVDAKPAQPAAPSADLPGGPCTLPADAPQCGVVVRESESCGSLQMSSAPEPLVTFPETPFT